MTPTKRITEFIKTEFLSCDNSKILPEDLDLVEAGIIDSLSLLKIIVFIEDELNIIIEPVEMNPETFSSLRSIFAFIQSKSLRDGTSDVCDV